MKIRFTLFCLLAYFVVLKAYSQAQNQSYLNYIDQYKYLAVDQMLKHKIPASITLAQGLLESAAGKSRSAEDIGMVPMF